MKSIISKFMNPNGFWCLLCLSFSIPALIFIFSNQLDHTFYAGVIYAISAYTLIVVCWKLLKLCKVFKKQLYTHELTKRLIADPLLRVRLSTMAALGINLIYALLKLYSGIYYSSTWLVTLAMYYSILAAMRCLLVITFYRHGVGTQLMKEYQTTGLCGILMFLLTVVLAYAAMQMILLNQTYDYAGSLIYAAAAYAFYSVGVSIYNWFKYRLQDSPLLFAAKNSSLASAFVSMLAMQTAMLTRFGSEDSFRVMMNTLSSCVVCLICMVLSLLLIKAWYKNKGLKRLE